MDVQWHIFNPLVTDLVYLVCMAKNFDLKKRRYHQKISYERRAYESVDDRSLLGYISKINRKQNSGTNRLMNIPWQCKKYV